MTTLFVFYNVAFILILHNFIKFHVIINLLLPWIGKVSMRLVKQISVSIRNCYLTSNLHVAFSDQSVLRSVCKDCLLAYHISQIINNFKCQCQERRINQHVPSCICKSQFHNLHSCVNTS